MKVLVITALLIIGTNAKQACLDAIQDHADISGDCVTIIANSPTTALCPGLQCRTVRDIILNRCACVSDVYVDSIRDSVRQELDTFSRIANCNGTRGNNNNCLNRVQDVNNCAPIIATSPTTALCPGMRCRAMYDNLFVVCIGDTDIGPSLDAVRQALDKFDRTSDCGGDGVNCLDLVRDVGDCAAIIAANTATALCPGTRCRRVYNNVFAECANDPGVISSLDLDALHQELDASDRVCK